MLPMLGTKHLYPHIVVSPHHSGIALFLRQGFSVESLGCPGHIRFFHEQDYWLLCLLYVQAVSASISVLPATTHPHP